jgi:hypothetical protein
MLIDLLLADIPTAVWRDRRGRIDVGNYDGLISVSSAAELTEFAQEALREPQRLVAHQRQWLDQQGMPRDPSEVYARFAQLFETGERMEVRRPGSRAERERILVLEAESAQPQQELQQALAALAANGEVASRTLGVRELVAPRCAADAGQDSFADHVATVLETYDPSVIIIVCGQEVSVYQRVLEWAKPQRVPVIYLLGFPAAGLQQGSPRGASFDENAGISALLHGVDVIYAPTQDHKARLQRAFPQLETIAAPAEQQVTDERQAAPEFQKSLLRIIALGHATVGSRASH